MTRTLPPNKAVGSAVDQQIKKRPVKHSVSGMLFDPIRKTNGAIMSIRENYLKIRREIPDNVNIVLAAKMKGAEEIGEALAAGAGIIGENYVQEAEKMHEQLGEKAGKVKWHFIGTLQKNKINKALKIFDCIQTVDSAELADEINKRARSMQTKVAVYIEVNIGSEYTKSGVEPNYAVIEELAGYIARLDCLRLEGLMTMGPRMGDPEKVRPFFKKIKTYYEQLKKANIPNVDLKYLSMGMSNSYKIAIEEGANMVRLGTVVFGARSCETKLAAEGEQENRIERR